MRMKNFLSTFLFIFVFCSTTIGQTNTSFRFRKGTTVPASCATGDVFFQTSDNTFQKCATANTWTAIGSGGGSVTSVSVTTANGVSGVVANPTTTPAITITLAAITPTTIVASGNVTLTGAVAGVKSLQINNTSNNAGAVSRILFTNDAAVNGYISLFSSTFGAGLASVFGFGADGIMQFTTTANPIRFFTDGGTTSALLLNSTGTMTLFTLTQATLGTPANGTIVYCSDCTIANPCAGAGTGALAKRLNGVWVCN